MRALPPRRRRSPRLLLVTALVLAALAAGALIWQHRALSEAEAARTEDRAALDAATLGTMRWASVDYREVDEFVEKVRDGATGQFLEEFEASESALRTIIAEQKSVQVPTIPKDGAALLERRGDEARVLIAMDAVVSNESTPSPQPRQYRLQVTVTKVKGVWLTSRLEIVDAQA